MLLFVQLFVVIALATAAVLLARSLAKTRFWLPWVLASLALILLILAGHRSPRLSFVPPISWLVDPAITPAVTALAIPLLLTTLILRLPLRRQRIALAAFTVGITTYYALFPLLMPLAVRADLLAGKTTIDPHGVCLQTHGYTCGPAAAVTCLRVLRIPAEEGPLAADAHSAPIEGTDGPTLAAAINRLTQSRNINCQFQFLSSLDAFTVPAIATIFSPRYGNHYVAVLEITPTEVILGDPLSGRARYTRLEFLTEWTGLAHTFRAGPPWP